MARFSSPRDALRVYFAARRGPRASKPRYDGMPSSGNYRPPDDSTWVLVGRMLHAGCGVEIDSPEERAVRNWAEGFDEKSYVARRVEEKMRELLREAELMAPARKVVRDDVDGTPWSRLMDAVLMGGGK